MLITFSGIEDSGKTTEANFVCSYLEKNGYITRYMRFARLEIFCLNFLMNRRLFRKITEVLRKRPSVDKKGPRDLLNDEVKINQQLSILRMIAYSIDIIIFRVYYWYLCIKYPKIHIICDRYFYDHIVNFYPSKTLKLYLKICKSLMPKPHLSILLFISPKEVIKRGTIFSLDYLQIKCERYNQLVKEFEEIKVIESNDISTTQSLIEIAIQQKLTEMTKRG